MVNDIVTGITVQLNKKFGDSKKIYTSNVEQGLEQPCFFVKLLTAINTPLIGKRKKRDYPFDIHYFPSDETDNEEMMAVGDCLMEVLEYIVMLDGDMLRGKDLEYEIRDGVLHFSVTYSCILNDITKGETMKEYDLEVGVKDGENKAD